MDTADREPEPLKETIPPESGPIRVQINRFIRQINGQMMARSINQWSRHFDIRLVDPNLRLVNPGQNSKRPKSRERIVEGGIRLDVKLLKILA